MYKKAALALCLSFSFFIRCFSSYSLFSFGVMSFTLFLDDMLSLHNFLQPSVQRIQPLLFLSRNSIDILLCLLNIDRYIFTYQQGFYLLCNRWDSSRRHFRSRRGGRTTNLLRLNYFPDFSTSV